MKKLIITLIASAVLLAPQYSLFAQSKLMKAREFKTDYQYSKAIELYLDYFKSHKPKLNDVRDIANCYLMMNDLVSAEEWLSKYNTLSVYSAPEMLNYAYALKSAGEYDDAINQFIKFEKIFPKKAENVPLQIISCVDAKKWTKKPANYRIVNMKSLNSENSDFALIPYKNGFLFSTDRKQNNKTYSSDDIFGWTGNPYLRIYEAPDVNEDEVKSNPSPEKNLNTKFHNGSGIYDFKNDILYFTITKTKKTKAIPPNSDPTNWESNDNLAEKYVNRMEIYTSRFRNNQWEEIQPFQYNNSDYYSVGHPALSPDGNILYFASNMPGGYGSSDIYYCLRLPDGSWDKPKNCGDMINTEGKEVFPVVDKGGILYFSSDGYPGMGGLDIFASTGSMNNWDYPENLKYPVNSPKDDFSPYFIRPGLSGYISSNRDGGKGSDDIYFFSKGLVIIGKTFARLQDNSIEPLESVDITIQNLTSDKSKMIVSDNGGNFNLSADCGNAYEFSGHKKGFFMQSKAIETVCNGDNDTVYVELILDQMLENKSYVLNNIYYDYDKWYIRPDAAKELNKLVALLKDNPEIDIELGSHTDSRGTDIYNQKLSQKRAEAAVEYIISMGIDPSRITAKGYGESKPAVNCKNCTDEEHQMNRRTEFTVTRIRTDDVSSMNNF